MGLFDGYFDPDQFGSGGGLLGRLLALQQQQGQYQPSADLNQTPAAPQMSAPAPLPWPNVPGYGLTPSAPQPPSPDLHSQYQALRPVLGDRNAMLAAVSPEVGQTLIAQALANPQKPSNVSASGSAATNTTDNALTDFYRQTILQAGKDIVGYVADAVSDPVAFSHAMGPSLAALGPLAGELPTVVKGMMGAIGVLRPAAQSNYGDLTPDEVQRIQSVVNEAGRPLEVVGSAARGTRTAKSDIDYVIPPSSMRYYEGLQGKLPGVDSKHGIIPGIGNANIGPVVRFEPK